MDSMNSAHSAVTRDDSMRIPPSQPEKKEEHIEQKKLEWLSMKSRMAALVEKADVSNVKWVAGQLLNEDITKGKGLFCQAVMKSQSESPESSDVYAALVALINFKFREVGYLLVMRVVLQFQEARDSGDKKGVQTAVRFLAQLVNHRVVLANLGITLFMLMLGNPTSDNVEHAASFCIQCGAMLVCLLPHDMKAIFGEFRRLLRKGNLEKRVQLLIVRLFAHKKRKFAASRRVLIDVLDNKDRDLHEPHEVCLWQDIDPETYVDEFRHKSAADEHSQLMVPWQDFDNDNDDGGGDDEVSSRAPHIGDT